MVACNNDARRDESSEQDTSTQTEATSPDNTNDGAVESSNSASVTLETSTGASIDTSTNAHEPSSTVNCATTETLCDGKDDDCNGLIDDVDVGHDGLCDCMRIGIMGKPGLMPSSQFQNWLKARGTSVERFGTDGNSADFDLPKLKQFDIVILDWIQGIYTSKHADIVANFIAQGGGIISMTGYENGHFDEVSGHNLLLSKLGVSYEVGKFFNSKEQTLANRPITNGVSQVAFAGGAKVNIDSSKPGLSSLAWAEDGSLIGATAELENGRAVVWGDEWISFDSEWSTLPGVKRFWAQMLNFVGPRNSCQVAIPEIL
jgi:hypothetical protein